MVKNTQRKIERRKSSFLKKKQEENRKNDKTLNYLSSEKEGAKIFWRKKLRRHRLYRVCENYPQLTPVTKVFA